MKLTAFCVFVASGYTDLATPFSATNYTFAHLGTRSLMDRVTMAYFDASPLMYCHQPSLRKLSGDLRKFIVNEPPPAETETHFLDLTPSLQLMALGWY